MINEIIYRRSSARKAVEELLEETLSPEEYAQYKKDDRKAYFAKCAIVIGTSAALVAGAFSAGYASKKHGCKIDNHYGDQMQD
jgi:hypothetical protein